MIERYGRGCLLHESLKTYGRNWIGSHTMVLEQVILGYPTSDVLLEDHGEKDAARGSPLSRRSNRLAVHHPLRGGDLS